MLLLLHCLHHALLRVEHGVRLIPLLARDGLQGRGAGEWVPHGGRRGGGAGATSQPYEKEDPHLSVCNAQPWAPVDEHGTIGLLARDGVVGQSDLKQVHQV